MKLAPGILLLLLTLTALAQPALPPAPLPLRRAVAVSPKAASAQPVTPMARGAAGAAAVVMNAPAEYPPVALTLGWDNASNTNATFAILQSSSNLVEWVDGPRFSGALGAYAATVWTTNGRMFYRVGLYSDEPMTVGR